MSKKWTLTIGIHRGTITSRDVEQPKEFDTREEAVAEVKSSRDWYARLGYVIWFADLVSPDGKKETLTSDIGYSR